MKKILLLVAMVVPFGLIILAGVQLFRHKSLATALDKTLWRAGYVGNLFLLLVTGRIDVPTAFYALREWPAAVAGKDGAWVIDNGIRMGNP